MIGSPTIELVRLQARVVSARSPERLNCLEELAAAWLMRLGSNTRDAYGCDFQRWMQWCAAVSVDPFCRRHPSRRHLRSVAARSLRHVTYTAAPWLAED
jgi:hypothetical protein